MWKFIKEHLEYKRQILYLAKSDLVKGNRGAIFGWLWELATPLVRIFAYWFVFRVGWEITTGAGKVEFLPWLVVGICAWLFIKEMLSKGTNSLKSYSYLVTKMKFPISTIPTFVALSRLVLHVVFLILALVYLYFKGYASIYWIQLPLYTILMVGFFITWSLFASPLAVISKDFASFVKSTTMLLFWLSGIIFSLDRIDISWIDNIMAFNPIYFIVEGYRKSLLYHQWFFEDMRSLVIFIGVFLVMIVLAYITFRRARRELVDVL